MSGIRIGAFNRTSMESKQRPMLRMPSKSVLLIEPVWNRNTYFAVTSTAIGVLLIEPVWNRNVDRRTGVR